MNIISFDIEEWYIEKKFRGSRAEQYRRYDDYLYRILDDLDANNIKATFFCLGKIAVHFPYVIKEIATRGHEIGCHSNEHDWLTKLGGGKLIADTKDAIKALEDVCMQRVVSYRAPGFSIGEKNKWAIEVLAECGIERDSSIFPAKRDFGGFELFGEDRPVIISVNNILIKEFPICTTKLLGRTVVFSGGGYFRFFPYGYIEEQIKRRDYTMCYFHLGDIIYNKPNLMSRDEYERYFKEDGSLPNRLKRCFKSSIGTKGAYGKLSRLIRDYPFVNLDIADKQIDWAHAPQIIL